MTGEPRRGTPWPGNPMPPIPSLQDPEAYPLAGALELSTPRLLVFRRHVEENILRMGALLEELAPGSGLTLLAPHAKTHKSLWATRRLLEAGVRTFKCTPNELDLLLEAGAPEIVVAYPLLTHAARHVCRAAASHERSRLLAQVGSMGHAAILAQAAAAEGVTLDVLIDVDVGQHRTGVVPARVLELARALTMGAAGKALRFRGLHAYDGHNSAPTLQERRECSRIAMAEVVACASALERDGIQLERILVGGSPGFVPDLEELLQRHQVSWRVQASPGTWIYWDTGYATKWPGAFAVAAAILARAMDFPGEDLVTLDLGYKRWACDQGPVTGFQRPDLEVVASSEEHTVLRQTGPGRLALDDPVLIFPRHVCSTVNLWERFTLIGPQGAVEELDAPVSARNR